MNIAWWHRLSALTGRLLHPRDDVVKYPYAVGGVTEGKIDGDCGVAQHSHWSHHHRPWA
jgi:hypothetical protein